jgi:uncharacterized phage protein gp47/JayE
MIAIPTLNELYTQILADLQAETSTTIPVFGKSYLRAQAAVQAAKLKIFYVALSFVQKNTLPDTADSFELGGTLQRWGLIKLGRLPFAATQGTYTVTVTGSIGATIAAQTIFKSKDSASSPSKLFILDNAKTLSATTDTMDLRALEAGLESKLIVGDLLDSTVPLINVNKTVTVSAEAIEPRAAETIEQYRTEVIQAFRTEPQGGAGIDYRQWSNGVQGVRQSYPYATTGAPNEVSVYVEATVADSTDGKGTPTSQLIDDVGDAIELNPNTSLPIFQRGRRPLGVFEVNVLPIDPLDVEVDIQGYQDLDATKQATITAAVTNYINAIRPFVVSCDLISERNDVISRFGIISVISQAVPGSVFNDVVLSVDGTPTASFQFTLDKIPYKTPTTPTFT